LPDRELEWYCSTVERFLMDVVAVKNKFQIVIPQRIREQVS